MSELGSTAEMREDQGLSSDVPIRTVAEIVYLVMTIIVAAYFGRFGGPFDDWIRQLAVESRLVMTLMYSAWAFLALGIVVRKPAFRYGFLTCWVILASLMRIYQEHHPVKNLIAALCVLIVVTILNRIGQQRTRRKELN